MKNIPQIHLESGISQDYWNQYFAKIMAHSMDKKDFLNELFRDNPIKKYGEVYPEKDYNHDFPAEIKLKILDLDTLTESWNKEFDGIKEFNEEKFKDIVNKVYRIVYGKNVDYYP